MTKKQMELMMLQSAFPNPGASGMSLIYHTALPLFVNRINGISNDEKNADYNRHFCNEASKNSIAEAKIFISEVLKESMRIIEENKNEAMPTILKPIKD
jgi:hypothetical protein